MTDKLHISYTDYCQSRRSKELYGDWSDSHEITPRGLLLEDEHLRMKSLMSGGNNYEYIPFLGDHDPDFSKGFHVVYAVYTTGDSFGASTGNVEWMCATQDPDFARALSGFLKNVKYNEYSCVFNYGGKQYPFHIPWSGYFERLERIETAQLRVL